MFIVDTDCHQVEPFRAMAKYAKDPIKNIFTAPDPEEDYIQRSIYTQYAGTYKDPTQHLRGIKTTKRPELGDNVGSYSSELLLGIFRRLMRDIGIKSSIVIPTPTLFATVSKPDAEVTVANAYIDYMLDAVLGREPDILTLAYIPTGAPDKAADLIERVGSEKGVAGFLVSGSCPTLAGSDSWDPIFDACQRKGMPLSFHGNRSIDADTPFYRGMEVVASHALGFPLGLIRHITSLIFSGVPVRFPNLKLVFMEGGITWLPWLYNRLDDEYTKRRIEAPLLEKLPSEYLKGFYYTSQPLEQSHPETLEPMFQWMDFENHLLYASDYPHWDFDVPSVIYDLPFLSESAKKKILGENARKVFKLE